MPPLALRDEKRQHEEERRRHGLRTEHDAPRDVARHRAENKVIRQLRKDDAQHDGHLVERDEPPAHLRRRDLGDVDRRDVRGESDTYAAQDTSCNERPVTRGERCPERAHGKANRSEDQRRLASEAVRQPSESDGAADASQYGRPHREPGLPCLRWIVQPEIRFVERLRASNHHPVVAEEQSAHRRHETHHHQFRLRHFFSLY